MPDQLSPLDLDPEMVGKLMDLEASGKLPPAYAGAMKLARDKGILPPPKPPLPELHRTPIPNPDTFVPEQYKTGSPLDPTNPPSPPKSFKDSLEDVGIDFARGVPVGVGEVAGGMVGSRFGHPRVGAAVGGGIGQGLVEGAQALMGSPSEHPFRNIAAAAGLSAIIPPPSKSDSSWLELPKNRKARNQAVLESEANPGGATPLQTGPKVQGAVESSHKAARDPLMQAYDQILGGPLGDVEVVPAQTTATNVSGTNFKMSDPITFRDMHAQASDLKARAKDLILSGDRAKLAEGADLLKQVSDMNQEMSDAATRAGQDPKPYQLLSELYKRMNEQFENKFMRQVKSTKGAGVVDLIANPNKWKSFRMSGQGSSMDVPTLLRVLKDNVGPGTYDELRSAVGKRILDQSMGPDGVRGQVLWTRLARLQQTGVLKELMPNGDRVMKAAELLANYERSAGQNVPAIFGRTLHKVMTKTIDALDKPPDLAQALGLLPKGHPLTVGFRNLLMGTAAGSVIPPPPDQSTPPLIRAFQKKPAEEPPQ